MVITGAKCEARSLRPTNKVKGRKKMKRLVVINIYRMRICLVLLLAAALTAALLALTEMLKPAQAAFPGVNGKIAYRGLDGTPTNDFEIFTMNPDGTAVTQLTDNTAYDSSPAFSADGTKIAFMSLRGRST